MELAIVTKGNNKNRSTGGEPTVIKTEKRIQHVSDC